ncbi:MAG: HD domain-containing protein [Planctomycetota bacterium]|jgi:uncharacterized protein
MDIKQIEAVALAEMESRRGHGFREPGWILYHGRRTGKIALYLADTIGCDVDRYGLYVTGLFHDVGKGSERHNEVGAARTRELLEGLVPAEMLDAVCETIRVHNQRMAADNYSDITKLIQDADLVDHVGHIDVWMALYYSGSQGQSIHDHLAWFTGDECREFRQYMRGHLNFDISHEMLEERIVSADRFFTELHRTYFEGL